MNIRNGFRARNFAIAFLAFLIPADNVFSQNPTPTPENDLIRVNTDLIQTSITVADASAFYQRPCRFVAHSFDWRDSAADEHAGKLFTARYH